jgi:hypothetical protein
MRISWRTSAIRALRHVSTLGPLRPSLVSISAKTKD